MINDWDVDSNGSSILFKTKKEFKEGNLFVFVVHLFFFFFYKEFTIFSLLMPINKVTYMLLSTDNENPNDSHNKAQQKSSKTKVNTKK